MGQALRVCVVGKIYEDSFASCIAEAFHKLGHIVCALDDQRFPGGHTLATGRMLWSVVVDRSALAADFIADTLVKKIVRFNPDIVLSVSKTLSPAVIEAVKKRTHAIAVFWFPDAVSNLGRQYFLASPFDLYCFKDHFLIDRIGRVLGLNCLFLPDATRITTQMRVDPPVVDLLIACNLYPYRAKLMESLQGFKWEIYGNVPRWLGTPLLAYHCRRYLSGDAKIHAYQHAAIVFNSTHPAEVQGINARTFEVCGAGAFLLTDHHPALSEYYEPGVDVGVYKSVADVRQQVEYYLANPDLRVAMARRAYARTVREHTYVNRIGKLLSVIKDVSC